MDDEVVIKQEPLYDIESETIFGCEYDAINQIEVKNENNMREMHVKATKGDRLAILAEKPNLITVCATESIKIEEELFYFEQTLSEGDHAYARLEDKSTNVFRSSKHYKFQDFNPLIHECQRNCGRKFATQTECASHECDEHKDVLRTIKCNFCNKNFDSFFALTRHMPEHRNVQRYVCTHCSECCTSYQNLQIHWRTSTGCFKEDSDTSKTISDIVLEEPRKITNLNTLQSNEKSQSNSQILPHHENTFPYQQKSNISSDHEIFSKPPSPFPLLRELPSTQQQPLSFADETKAFAAKYQLKSSLVAKKRTAAMVIKPISTTGHKRSKKSRKEKFEIISQYAVPKAIGFCDVINPELNMKIKEEPMDQYDEILTDKSDSAVISEINIKSEPMDEYIEVKNEAYDDSVEDVTLSSGFESHFDLSFTSVGDTERLSDMHSTIPLHKTSSSNGSVPINSLKIIKMCATQSNNSENKNFPLASMKLDGNLDSKNLKILKLAPNAKIIKLPSVQVESFKNFNECIQTSKEAKTLAFTLNHNSPTTPAFVPIKLPYSNAKPCLSIDNFETNSFKVESEFPAIKEENEKKTSVVKILEEAISNGQTNKRINCVPKEILSFIERQPQKMKIIEDIQRQIQIAKNISHTHSSVKEHIEEKSSIEEQAYVKQEQCNDSNVTTNLELAPPTSFFFPINENERPELSMARREYRNYRFSWVCPRCPKLYEQKHAFLGHLVSVHSMCRNEFENLIVEVRPFQNNKSTRNRIKKKHKEYIKKQNLQMLHEQPKEQNSKLRFLTNSQLRCPKCNRFCSSRRMLNDHIAGDCSRKPQYQCSNCPKAFYSAQTLNCHMSIHTGELPHKCDFCDKRFRTRGQVTVHHRTHTGEKPFICQICSQRFTHRETLISHLSRHIGMKRYRCYACSEHFSCISGLKAHHELRPDTCGKVKLNTRAVGPRVRVVRGQVHFEPQPEINAYLRTEDPPEILSEIQNIQKTNSEE